MLKEWSLILHHMCVCYSCNLCDPRGGSVSERCMCVCVFGVCVCERLLCPVLEYDSRAVLGEFGFIFPLFFSASEE